MEERLKALEEAVAELTERLDNLQGKKQEKPAERAEVIIPPAEVQKQNKSLNMANLLGVVSVICFILAAIFIIKLAISSGWLTAEKQWTLTILLGAALCGVGRYFEKIEKDYRSYLSGAGVVVLYLSALSSSLYFELFSPDASLILGMMVSFIGLSLFQFHRNELFAVLTVTGTYLSLLFLKWDNLSLNFSSSYFLLWASLFSFMASHFKSRVITLLASYYGIGLYTLINQYVAGTGDLITVLLVLALQFIIFCYGLFYYTFKNKTPLSQKEAWSYFPVLCFYYGTSYYYLVKLAPSLAPWIALSFALLLFASYQGMKKKLDALDIHGSRQMVYAFLGVVLLQAGYLEVLPGFAKPWLLPIFIIFDYIGQKKSSFPRMAPIFKIISLLVGLLEFLKLCGSMLLNSATGNELLVAFTTIGLGIFYYSNIGKGLKSQTSTFLACVHVLAVLSLLKVAEPFGSLYVSVAWALYAVLILLLGFKKKDEILAKSSLVVLLIASLKALIYDASQAPTGIRILCLLLTGLLLYLTGFMFQKMQKWTDKSV